MRIILKRQPLFGYFFIPILTIIIISSFLFSLAYAIVIKETHEIDPVHILCPINILIVLSVILIIGSIVINIFVCFERYDKPYKLIV